MTAVDHAELKRLADALRVPWSDRGWTLASLLKEARQAADGLDALLSEIEGLKAERANAKPWQDRKDEWSEAISAAHPVNSDLPWRHECFETAMEMVGNRHGKYELVALVSWLLSDLQSLRTQAPDSWRPDREAVANIIWERFAPSCDMEPENAKRGEYIMAADAILALRPQTAESGK